MKPIWRILLVGLVALAVPALSPIPASAADLTVNLTTDAGDLTCDGTCTLRDAIDDANGNPGQDTILFNIPGSPNVILPTSPLQNIVESVIIDGFTDPDTSRVEISGASAGPGVDGLTITGEGVTIKGLVIRNFTNDGIDIAPAATQNNVESNFIGTDLLGAGDQGNGGNGVDVRGSANTIGGPDLGNVISGNAQSGVSLTSSSSTANVVEGNSIGTDASGTAALGNDNHGVVVTSSANSNTIGGSTSAERNVISGNGILPSNGDGVRIQGGATTNVVQGNFIGTNAGGTSALPNTLDGVGLRGSAFGNIVGGTAAGTGNVISGNGDDGIQVGTLGDTTTTRNRLLGNSTSENGNTTAPHNELGIDLVGTNGVDANDLGDPDSGPNNLQNFPVLTSAASSSTTTTISGTLNSEASKTYRLEFFSNDACDSSGNGEGQRFLGATSVTTDSSGNVNFTASSLTGGVAGQMATATATDPDNNTSEFSACTTVAVDTTPPVTPDTTPPTTPTTNAGGKFQKQRTFTVTWTTSTDTTGPVRYDVRYREAPYNGGFGGFVNWQSTTTATSATFTGAPGTTYCFSARAIDGAGNASPFGTEGCTNVPVDNPTFKHRGKWAKKTGAGYYLNTFSRTKKKGAKLTLPGVQAKALSVIVTKCKSCGVIKVFFKGKLLKRINLRSKAKARQKLRFVNLNPFASAQTGTVRITVVSTGKLVIVEGLGVSAV